MIYVGPLGNRGLVLNILLSSEVGLYLMVVLKEFILDLQHEDEVTLYRLKLNYIRL